MFFSFEFGNQPPKSHTTYSANKKQTGPLDVPFFCHYAGYQNWVVVSHMFGMFIPLGKIDLPNDICSTESHPSPPFSTSPIRFPCMSSDFLKAMRQVFGVSEHNVVLNRFFFSTLKIWKQISSKVLLLHRNRKLTRLLKKNVVGR